MLKKDRVKLLSVIGGLVGLIIIFLLAYRFIAPFGKIVNFRFTSKLPGSQQATVFSPGPEKGSILQIPTQIITTSKSKIQLKLPQGKVETIKTALKFKPNINEVIIGVRGNEKDNFFFQPLYRDVFRDLNWNQVKEAGFTLWQRQGQYKTIHDFISNPPLDKKIAFYYLDKDKFQELQSEDNKKDKNAKTIIETSLRSSHSLLIRVDQSPLIIKVAKQDMNGYDGEDKLKITVSKDGKNLAEKTIADDGIVDASRLKLKPQEETITLENINPGIYDVNLIDESGKADVLITKIEINQTKAVFKNNIFPLGNSQTTLWTDISDLNVVTVHDAGLQTIKLDDQYDLKIEQIDKRYEFDLADLTGSKLDGKIHKLVILKNDLMINGNGYFSFSKEAFFLPGIVKGEELNNLANLDNVDYILTSYNPPQKEGDWMTAEAYFNLQDIKVDGDTLYFSLEVPQIAKYGGQLEIDYLDISLGTKEALEKIKIKEEKSADNQVEKQNMVQKGKTWLGAKWNQLTNWVSNTWQKVFKKTPKEEANKEELKTDNKGAITITNTKPSPTPSPSPSPKPSPSPAPKEKITNFVRILNGGAGQGGAGEFAKVLLGAGFTNVTAETADKTDYKNAIIKYRQEDEKVAAKLEELLKKDYKVIDMQKIATTSAEIVVIIGEK